MGNYTNSSRYSGSSRDVRMSRNQMNSRNYCVSDVVRDCNCQENSEPCDDVVRTRDMCAGMALAMAYVPWQNFECTYEPMQGLHAGTIFPELEKPFYGRRGMR